MTKTFLTTPGSYPTISQKVLKGLFVQASSKCNELLGAAARFLAMFLAERTGEVAASSELAGHRANVFVALVNQYQLMGEHGRFWSNGDAPQAMQAAFLMFRESYGRTWAHHKISFEQLRTCSACLGASGLAVAYST